MEKCCYFEKNTKLLVCTLLPWLKKKTQLSRNKTWLALLEAKLQMNLPSPQIKKKKKKSWIYILLGWNEPIELSSPSPAQSVLGQRVDAGCKAAGCFLMTSHGCRVTSNVNLWGETSKTESSLRALWILGRKKGFSVLFDSLTFSR